MISRLPTTNLRIATSLLLALGTGVRVLLSPWEPPTAWLVFLLGMMGIDVAQFTAKRVTWKGDSS